MQAKKVCYATLKSNADSNPGGNPIKQRFSTFYARVSSKLKIETFVPLKSLTDRYFNFDA